MRVLFIVLFSLQLLLAQDINQKMIISAHFKTEAAAKSLYEVEKFFQENSEAKQLKKMHHLVLEMELLEPYVMVTLKPIKLTSLKNKLHYLLQSKFPKNFIVNNTQIEKIPTINKKENVVSTLEFDKAKKTQERTALSVNKVTEIDSKDRYKQMKKLWTELDNEWIGLIFLALAGFLLVYRSARQMSKIKALQDEVIKYQTQVEGEMDYMGEKNA